MTKNHPYLLSGHSDLVLDIAISINNEYLISGSNDRTIRIWDIQKSSLINTINCESPIYSIALLDNFFVVCIIGNDVTIFYNFLEKKTEKRTVDHSEKSKLLSISNDSNLIALGLANPDYSFTIRSLYISNNI